MNTVSEVKTYSVSDLPIKVVKKNIKNLHVAVLPPDGKVRVTAPKNMKEEAIRMAIISRLQWIKKQQQKFLNQDRQTKRDFVGGESHYYLGKHYLLKIVEGNVKPAMSFNGRNYIEVKVRPNTSEQRKEEMLTEWYRQELRKMINELIKKWEKKMNVKANKITIKRMKTRWGTCNKEKKLICLNLELIKKPVQCIEYVFVHELCHLIEKKHNQSFVDIITSYIPNWEARKEELNRFPLSYERWRY